MISNEKHVHACYNNGHRKHCTCFPVLGVLWNETTVLRPAQHGWNEWWDVKEEKHCIDGLLLHQFSRLYFALFKTMGKLAHLQKHLQLGSLVNKWSSGVCKHSGNGNANSMWYKAEARHTRCKQYTLGTWTMGKAAPTGDRHHCAVGFSILVSSIAAVWRDCIGNCGWEYSICTCDYLLWGGKSAGSDDTASMIKGGGYIGARTRRKQLKRNQCGSGGCVP